MAKWYNSNVRLHSLARKRIYFYKLLASNSSYAFETLYINYCTWVEVNDKNIGKVKNNQQKLLIYQFQYVQFIFNF